MSLDNETEVAALQDELHMAKVKHRQAIQMQNDKGHHEWSAFRAQHTRAFDAATRTAARLERLLRTWQASDQEIAMGRMVNDIEWPQLGELAQAQLAVLAEIRTAFEAADVAWADLLRVIVQHSHDQGELNAKAPACD